MSTDRSAPNPMLKLAIELGPLVAFFIAQRRADLLVATAVFMVAMTISVLVSWRMEGRLPVMPLITLVFVLLLGGLTLALGETGFIKVKPTFTNVTFAAILGIGMLRGKLFLKTVFQEAFQLEDEGWRVLTLRFVWFFLALAVLNEIVWRNFSDDRWTDFKVFGIMPLTIAFMVAQSPLLNRYAIKVAAAASEEDEPRATSGSED
ncbi:MAG: septation protein A [Planctomycetota bacterium]|nr:septation protein A [Planctomycetota bacterium]